MLRMLVAGPTALRACLTGGGLAQRQLPAVASAARVLLVVHARPVQQQRHQSDLHHKQHTFASNSTGGKRSISNKAASDDGGEKKRLSKVLAAAGLASRRGAEDLIDKGVVKVNGHVVKEQGLHIDPHKDEVEVEGRTINVKSPTQLYYFAVNKPKGFICSNAPQDKEHQGRRAVDLLEDWLEQWRKEQTKGALPPRLFTVGRLDVATQGLVFLTNDGHWAQKVIHPSANITKEYIVSVDRSPSKAQCLHMMKHGAEIDGVVVRPLQLEVMQHLERKMRMVVAEGKNHEVREIVAAAGLEVLGLKRVRVGGFRMPRTLGLGQYMELSSAVAATVHSLKIQEKLMMGLEVNASMDTRPRQHGRQQGTAGPQPDRLMGRGPSEAEIERWIREDFTPEDGCDMANGDVHGGFGAGCSSSGNVGSSGSRASSSGANSKGQAQHVSMQTFRAIRSSDCKSEDSLWVRDADPDSYSSSSASDRRPRGTPFDAEDASQMSSQIASSPRPRRSRRPRKDDGHSIL